MPESTRRFPGESFVLYALLKHRERRELFKGQLLYALCRGDGGDESFRELLEKLERTRPEKETVLFHLDVHPTDLSPKMAGFRYKKIKCVKLYEIVY